MTSRDRLEAKSPLTSGASSPSSSSLPASREASAGTPACGAERHPETAGGLYRSYQFYLTKELLIEAASFLSSWRFYDEATPVEAADGLLALLQRSGAKSSSLFDTSSVPTFSRETVVG